MTSFKIHTPENAPEHSRPLLKELVARLGLLPNVYAAVSESPTALRAWLGLKTTLETGLFTPVERRIVAMTGSYLVDSSVDKVESDNDILVSVQIWPFPDAATADKVEKALAKAGSKQFSIWCPTSSYSRLPSRR